MTALRIEVLRLLSSMQRKTVESKYMILKMAVLALQEIEDWK